MSHLRYISIALVACVFLTACDSAANKQPDVDAAAARASDASAATTSSSEPADGVPDVRCEVEESVERLTRAELEAIRSGDSKFNSLVSELANRWPPKEPPSLPDTTNATEIDWEQAKRMVWNALVTTTIQAHDRTVVLVTTSGRSYRTVEPRLDDIWRVAALMDPCHRYITHITE